MTQAAPLAPTMPRLPHRRAGAAVAAILIALAAFVGANAQNQLPANPGFMPAFGALVVLSEALTATLLLVQSALPGYHHVRGLGAAYLFSAMIVVPHILAFPAVFAQAPVIGGPQSAVWLWCFWHGGFAVAILRHLLLPPGRPKRHAWRGVVLAVGAIVLALALLATAGAAWLPPLIVATDFRRLISTGIGPLILGLTLAALVVSVVKRRWDRPLDVWLSVALLAATLDVALTVFGASRFTLGWYSARVLSLLTGVIVLACLLAELMREAGRVATVNLQLERLLLTDVLTEVANRRAFDGAIEGEWARACRERAPISVLMIDIDVFKGFNDLYGHPAGDTCLQDVARALRTAAWRPADLVARIGGEEFAILLPGTDETGALEVAERAIASVSHLGIPHAANGPGIVTVSIGMATDRPSSKADAPAPVISRADGELYKAKSAGRNRVCPLPLRALAAA